MATLYKVEDDNLNVIHPQVTEVEPENGHHFSLQELHKMIGGYIEIVQLGEGRIAVVDESGILKSRIYNFLASSKTYRALYGNVLICKSKQVR